MKSKLYHEEGSISIDALLGITIFTLAVLAIMMISMVARVQSTMQYALSQTAKEISGYYYMLDKTGLTKIAANANEEEQSDIDKTIGHVLEFSGNLGTASEDAKKITDKVQSMKFDTAIDDVEDIKNITVKDAQALMVNFNTLTADVETLGKDPAGQLKGVFAVFAKTMLNKGLSYYVAPWVCRNLIPHYLGGDKEKANKMLESMGIMKIHEQSDYLHSLDFSHSELLADGRSIKLVVIYRLNPEKVTLGFIKFPENQGMIFRQVASTSAWIVPDGENTFSVSKAYERSTKNTE